MFGFSGFFGRKGTEVDTEERSPVAEEANERAHQLVVELIAAMGTNQVAAGEMISANEAIIAIYEEAKGLLAGTDLDAETRALLQEDVDKIKAAYNNLD